MKGKKAAKSIIYNAIILAIGLIMIYPLVWMIMSSFKETNIIFKTAGQLIPKKWVLDNYINGWKGFGGVSFGRFFSNSLFIAVVATIGTIVSSALVGFGFSRFQFRGKGILFAAMLASMMLPAPRNYDEYQFVFRRLFDFACLARREYREPRHHQYDRRSYRGCDCGIGFFMPHLAVIEVSPENKAEPKASKIHILSQILKHFLRSLNLPRTISV